MDTPHIKYFGFWPLASNYFVPDQLCLNEAGYIDASSKEALLEKIFEASGNGWSFAVTGDYLFMLHLNELEQNLADEQSANQATKNLTHITLGVSRYTRFRYCECLNAIYFLLFGACFTGRGNSILHDFTELTIWSCGRFTYDRQGQALRGGQFVRPPEQQLRRLRLTKIEDPNGMPEVDINIFRDAAFYWSIVHDLELASTASVGAKLLSEHRLENFKASVSLAWLEIEEWIVSFAMKLGLDVYQRRNGSIKTHQETGDDVYKAIKVLIDDYPEGTWIHAKKKYFHNVRILRNKIAHKGYMPTQRESSLAIETFVQMFNFRSGLNLHIDTHRVPTHGVS